MSDSEADDYGDEYEGDLDLYDVDGVLDGDGPLGDGSAASGDDGSGSGSDSDSDSDSDADSEAATSDATSEAASDADPDAPEEGRRRGRAPYRGPARGVWDADEVPPPPDWAEIGRVPEARRLTSETMSRPEYARLLAVRTQAIGRGSAPLVEVPPGVDTAQRIAEIELRMRRCPLALHRRYARYDWEADRSEWVVEVWRAAEMRLPPHVEHGLTKPARV